MHDMTIFIPTRGRIKQKTWMQLKEAGIPAVLVCDQKDADRFMRNKSTFKDALIKVTDQEGIHNVRQFIVECCSTRYAMMLDDDMEFFKRKSKEDWHLEKCDVEALRGMFREVMYYLDVEQYPLVGISARQGNNRQSDTVVFNTRMNNAYAMDCHLLRKHDIRWDRMPLMEDFDVTLQLLRLGYPNAVIYHWAWNQNGGSNAQGGCSGYRTGDMQAECAEQLKAYHPDFVTVVEKKAKAAWKGMETRKDVRIQWKKAFASAKKE